MANKKPSLLKAAESYTAAESHPNWVAKLQQRDPALAEEVRQLVEEWKQGQRPNFPHATSLAEFLAPHVGVSMDTIYRWIRRA